MMTENQKKIAMQILKTYKKDHFQNIRQVGDRYFVESRISTIQLTRENEIRLMFNEGALPDHSAIQALDLQNEFGNVIVNKYGSIKTTS